MKPGELFRGIFGLAVKLTGLFFLYLSFRDVPPILQLPTMTGYTTTDLISATLPMIFNLIVGWWLVWNKFLVRCAYPELPRSSSYSDTPSGSGMPTDKLSQPTAANKVETVEKKLAELLKKPKNTDSEE